MWLPCAKTSGRISALSLRLSHYLGLWLPKSKSSQSLCIAAFGGVLEPAKRWIMCAIIHSSNHLNSGETLAGLSLLKLLLAKSNLHKGWGKGSTCDVMAEKHDSKLPHFLAALKSSKVMQGIPLLLGVACNDRALKLWIPVLWRQRLQPFKAIQKR